MVYAKTKPFLTKFKILMDLENPIISRKIANLMNIVTFLDSDYIIYKDDIGVEMYFII